MRPGRPRPILSEDHIAPFDCGNDQLNAWLTDRTLRNERSGDARTYVSIDLDTGAVAGCYTRAAWSIAHADVGGGGLSRDALIRCQ